MEAEAEVLEPFELPFSDLLLLSSAASAPSRLSSSPQELARLESLSAAVMQALGPSGAGLLSITGVPKAPALRRALLPLARKLALLDNKDRARILKEHGLGSDVPLKNPDRGVSSFALQLKYGQDSSLEMFSSGLSISEQGSHSEEDNSFVNRFQEFNYCGFEQLGKTFKELGLCMMQLGLHIAQICDKAIGGRELEQSIINLGSAKGRLIHYHSTLDNLILKENHRRTKKVHSADLCPSKFHTTISGGLFPRSGREPLDELHAKNCLIKDRCCRISLSSLWQQWHYDYGIFTVLTTPLFMLPCQIEDCSSVSNSQECSSPDGHTYLQLFDTKRNKLFAVKSPPESFIIQVGEAADILSGGKLCSTLHSVGRPVEIENLSRETFVVFLQPSWDKTLSYPAYLSESKRSRKLLSNKETSGSCNNGSGLPSTVVAGTQEPLELMQEILRKIPPLSSRLRDGMTFAEFSRETTKQYYSGSGTQSMR
ncbi:uncharacterized protein LOC108510662 [Phoenix dactylifera]|uniref:Uncharacterized protein LOC108510662 n=1 Tax=Phoenix dactylifera TaxID=42345 RepID=A0A8B7MWZ0_PHODC|nr:uncharacterized protein LOC108510662 [Phoenix dactylifera]XP_038977283.1 uncharacterized protein LOC108510662 [Phoenix dactylifera]XP_038977284.1 uncharacterized protein LOC108510662 [Phoenix dactylifera]XP_038977286.1 uncharacterized protein LOC108510662 [Phoenix dactylifera]